MAALSSDNVTGHLIAPSFNLKTEVGLAGRFSPKAQWDSTHSFAAFLPHARPGLAHEKVGVGALARRVLLDSAGSYFGGVEIALFVGGEPVDAPHTALARAKRSPR